MEECKLQEDETTCLSILIITRQGATHPGGCAPGTVAWAEVLLPCSWVRVVSYCDSCQHLPGADVAGCCRGSPAGLGRRSLRACSGYLSFQDLTFFQKEKPWSPADWSWPEEAQINPLTYLWNYYCFMVEYSM